MCMLCVGSKPTYTHAHPLRLCNPTVPVHTYTVHVAWHTVTTPTYSYRHVVYNTCTCNYYECACILTYMCICVEKAGKLVIKLTLLLYAGGQRNLFLFVTAILIVGGKMVIIILAEKKVKKDMCILGQSLYQHTPYEGSG